MSGFESWPIGELACLTAALAWSLAVAWFRGPIARHGAWAVSLTKNLVAAVLLGVTTVLAGQAAALADASVLALVLVAASGIAGLAVGDTALFASVDRLGVHRALLLQTLGPVFAAILAYLALGERPGSWTYGGAVLVLIGVAIVLSSPAPVPGPRPGPRPGPGAPPPPAAPAQTSSRRRSSRRRSGARQPGGWGLGGVAFGVLAALGQGSGVVLAKAGMEEIPVLAASFVRLGAAVVGLVVVLAVWGRLATSLSVWRSPRAFGRLLGPTLLGTYLGFLLMMAGVAWAPATVAAVLLSTSPVFSLFVEARLGTAPITLRSAGGTAVAMAGVVVLTVL